MYENVDTNFRKPMITIYPTTKLTIAATMVGPHPGNIPASPALRSLIALTVSRMPAPNTAGIAIRKLTRTAASRV